MAVLEVLRIMSLKKKLNADETKQTKENSTADKTYPHVEHERCPLQKIDKQTEHTNPMSIDFLWQKHLHQGAPVDALLVVVSN